MRSGRWWVSSRARSATARAASWIVAYRSSASSRRARSKAAVLKPVFARGCRAKTCPRFTWSAVKAPDFFNGAGLGVGLAAGGEPRAAGSLESFAPPFLVAPVAAVFRLLLAVACFPGVGFLLGARPFVTGDFATAFFVRTVFVRAATSGNLVEAPPGSASEAVRHCTAAHSCEPSTPRVSLCARGARRRSGAQALRLDRRACGRASQQYGASTCFLSASHGS